MKKVSVSNLFLLFLSGLLITLFSACSDEEECRPTSLDISSLEVEYGCTNTPYQMDVLLLNNFTVISSQEVFDELVSGSCTPQIDFDKYSLVIGKQGLTNGFSSIEYEWSDLCEDRYEMVVTIQLNATAEAPNITFHSLVDAIPLVSEVAVQIRTNQ